MLYKTLSFSLALALAGCTTAPREYTELAQPRAVAIAPLRAASPVVALVLGAGGSRGFAHVGVIKALEAAGIRPEIVVGSSSGSVVAALYAGGGLPWAVAATVTAYAAGAGLIALAVGLA